MAGDYTRFRYSPLKDTNGVLMQQGRVLLDQDWNEYVQLQDRRWRSETMDIMGRAVVPMDTPNAFEILIGGTSFTIGIGRMYVDGLQPENHGIDPADPTKRKYDPILGELVGTQPIPYEQQPYLPKAILPPLPTDNSPHLVYLDVWERELTYLEDPGLIDQAVAVDTGTRLQTVWQVKVLTDQGNFDCSTPPFSVPSLAPSAGRLTTAAAGVPASTDPCIVPANGGYRGSGNRCYRIEIHNGGPMGTATFKWSRDNASVATAVTGINASLDTLTVVLTKRDSVLRFQPDDWVEVTDDFRYFAGLPGEMRQVAAVDDVNLTIQLKTALPAGEFDATKPDRHTRVIRWDQKGIVFDPLGNKIVDVDTNGGLIPVPAAGTTIVLEDGIQITFSIDTSMLVPNFHALDYWMFDARVVDASIEILTQAPPRGILHHYAWLATVTLPSGPASNCRVFWPPSGGESCDCTVCVTADSHNSGALTLQSAVNRVTATGGKICLAPGTYLITSPVSITGASNIEISGHGLPALVASGPPSLASIIQIERCSDVNIEDISFVGPVASGNQPPLPGVVITNSLFTRIKRCLFTGLSPAATGVAGPSSMSQAVGLAGIIFDAQIHDCFFNNVQVAIGPVTLEGAKAPFVFYASIQDNVMVCTNGGLKFDDRRSLFLDVSFSDNIVTGPVGFRFAGQGLDIAIEKNAFALTAVTASGLAGAGDNAAIACAGSQVRISNNQIFSADVQNQGRDGIVLEGRVMLGSQVTGNQIDALAGNGILVREGTVLVETVISQNQLLRLGGTGILMEKGSFVIDLNITDNSMAFLGLNAKADAMGGIFLLGTSVTVNMNDNAIEAVGPATPNAFVGGVVVMMGADMHMAGNRIINIDAQDQAKVGVGIFAITILGRLDIVDNEVRRAEVPPVNGSSSLWSAVMVGAVVAGALNIRGNMLESFGNTSTVLLLLAPSCIFTDNQCVLDNVATAAVPTPLTEVVHLGVNAKTTTGGAIMASNNFVQTPLLPANPKQVVMNLNPKDKDTTLTVLGNITGGIIQVSGGTLAGTPWANLNVSNV